MTYVKTTVDLPDELLIEAKKRAAEERTSLRKLIARGLRRELSAERGGMTDEGGEIAWESVVVAGGLPPGVDISSRADMHEWLRSQRE